MPRPSASTNRRPRPLPVSGARLRRFPLPPLSDECPEKAQLERILTSRSFSGARRSQLFLRYVVQHTIAYPDEPLKEYSIALDVFDRDASYDPAIDATVRVEAGRLRSRLLEYYAGEGHADPLLIEIPRGHYRAVIRPRQPSTAVIQSALPRVSGPQLFPRLRRLWAIPVAFLLGAVLGRRASH